MSLLPQHCLAELDPTGLRLLALASFESSSSVLPDLESVEKRRILDEEVKHRKVDSDIMKYGWVKQGSQGRTRSVEPLEVMRAGFF